MIMVYEAVPENLATLLGRLVKQLYEQTGRTSEKRNLKPTLKTLAYITKLSLFDKYKPGKDFNVFLGEVAIKPDDNFDLVVKKIKENFQLGFLRKRGFRLSKNPMIRREEMEDQIKLNYPYLGDIYELEDFMKKIIDCIRSGSSKYRFVLPNLYIHISRRLEEVVPQLVFTDYLTSIFATITYLMESTIELEIIHHYDTDGVILRNRKKYKKATYDISRVSRLLDITHELNAMIIKEEPPY